MSCKDAEKHRNTHNKLDIRLKVSLVDRGGEGPERIIVNYGSGHETVWFVACGPGWAEGRIRNPECHNHGGIVFRHHHLQNERKIGPPVL